MSDSVRFDRAAPFYDRTRALSPAALAGIVSRLTGEIQGRGRCLEIGVGTGRIALPLHGQGIRMAGVDLSTPMLAQLVANAGGRPPFPLAMADATVLPFRDASMGAAVVVHVLHLIEAWREAVSELVRVVQPLGVVVIDPGGVGWEPDELESVFRSAAGITVRNIGLQSVDELDKAMAALGAGVRELPAVDEVRTRSAAERLDAWESNIYSFTWRLPSDVRMRAAAEARAWALKNLDVDRPTQQTIQIRMRAYDLP